MPTAHRDVRWEAELASKSRFRRLDGEALVFDPACWETRLLTALSAAVFETLLRSPATTDELAAKLATWQPTGACPAELLQRVREILDELNRYGLIRPCANDPNAHR
jgi:PqqD family protein of HPr-rel-A system